MPIYAGGNHAEVRRRAGQYAQGWMPAVLSPEEIERGVADVHRAAAAARRDGTTIDIAPQFAVSIGRTHEEAIRRFRASQLFKHLESLKRSTLREQTGGFEQRNLIGSPSEISERIRAYERVGVTTLSGMVIYGLLLLVIVIRAPDGLEGVIQRRSGRGRRASSPGA